MSASLAQTPSIPVLDLFSLKGKAALVTGANRGIGASIALALAQAGAHVVLVHRNEQTSTSTLETINAWYSSKASSDASTPTKALVVYADLSGKDGEIDIVVHAAGIQRRAPAVQFGDDEWEEVINVNLSSAFYLARGAAQHMLSTPSTTTSGGKIILLGSLTFQGGLTVPAYASAKSGIAGLTRALSNEWSKQNINVNAICPGYINTDMNTALIADPVRSRQIGERIPAGRWGEGWDFAGVSVWLASEASKYVCGECVVVDGGWMGR
ncbi:2-dehydro-3-deoxy-D-gluconate 5-dehydrogenase {ECO:0000303/PubMed:24509771} {ECO:0000269/Ref.4}; AltName: Full=2-deoxy-D-gluconate 3-dehydrogenase {ECO:0000303/PubMed:23437267}; AltName: Full=2-keto-3-deoxygluconate 5-dehydrogenase; AltName: Full=2-keto-3-deoxygluconate oxidoreductase {ECO:0000303/Ref.4}; Short=KDG oxidoreductase; AltName: Full=20-ketosteroid reductase {ECO:0000303/PubMed:24509771}; {ECO:0000269/PubMed:24509771} [Serendipita indica DSM 11827]|nr:2-dehydro-3-deoxy-D-gluconate 5-dehydrogenase {ECO:0000303/PubMed:24509771} {ECO:0000269/Ref.4}; AltName: Full=2-deoxy-D-gluconate 3-dehydrogenase {ECO:0000303/PubMed:23437267}; AltName: Full=2-keto-3-deoxygluconate 5-dehydrogenase; AltName: Full=2-keto-3-deoxygluconate oxidoreductase {ECO:0000303/Ref.4}; Short=KDG oxidoreductase; AltName: Full=20-ketosteroid reductase {ECO:0000303/PubMed:24509771}; {ECO:0000269/PubMed:24509771} [Serendipita indica DSM 11827]